MRLSLLESDLKSRIEEEMREMAERRTTATPASAPPPMRAIAPTLVDMEEASVAPPSIAPAALAPSVPPLRWSSPPSDLYSSPPPPPYSSRSTNPSFIPPPVSTRSTHPSFMPPGPVDSMVAMTLAIDSGDDDAMELRPRKKGTTMTLLALAAAILIASTTTLVRATMGGSDGSSPRAVAAALEPNAPAMCGMPGEVKVAVDEAAVAPAPTLKPGPRILRKIEKPADSSASATETAPAPTTTAAAAAAAVAPAAPEAAPATPTAATTPAPPTPAPNPSLDQAARTAQMLRDQLNSSVH